MQPICATVMGQFCLLRTVAYIYNMSRLLRAYEYFCGLLLFYDASSGLTEKYSTKPIPTKTWTSMVYPWDVNFGIWYIPFYIQWMYGEYPPSPRRTVGYIRSTSKIVCNWDDHSNRDK